MERVAWDDEALERVEALTGDPAVLAALESLRGEEREAIVVRRAAPRAGARADSLSPCAEQRRLFGVLRRAPTAADRAVQIDLPPRSSAPGAVRVLARRPGTRR